MSQDISLLNTAIGPVMRGPSSSHSAAPYMIGRTVRELALTSGDSIRSVSVRFDPSGSFAAVYSNQGSDEGFAAGLSGVEITSEEYKHALRRLRSGGGFEFTIELCNLSNNIHPNRVDVVVRLSNPSGEQREDLFQAVSLGGGVFCVNHMNGYAIEVDGSAHTLLVEHRPDDFEADNLFHILKKVGHEPLDAKFQPGLSLFMLRRRPSEALIAELSRLDGVHRLRSASPTQEVVQNRERTLFSAAQIINEVGDDGDMAGYALSYECRRLGRVERDVEALFDRRVELMAATVERGLRSNESPSMKFLAPSARKFADSTLPDPLNGSFMKTAIAGALAAMEQTTSRGVMCAAPTAGSAGIVPGTLYALGALGATKEQLRRSLQVMALVGAVFAVRGSYAAETGGCSVETGTSAAMAAAGITYFYGGTPTQIIGAASLCLMNTLGLVCDPVGGEVEIPCHARNIAGVAHAWSAAIAALGGFDAVIPFDELVEQTVKIGQKMDPDLRCTARGGCAASPTALRMVSRLAATGVSEK